MYSYVLFFDPSRLVGHAVTVRYYNLNSESNTILIFQLFETSNETLDIEDVSKVLFFLQ